MSSLKRENEDYRDYLDKGTYNTANKQFPQGFANYYYDSYGALRNYLESVGAARTGGTQGAFANLLSGFQGGIGDLEEFMRQNAPFMAAGLAGSRGFRGLHAYEPLAQSIEKSAGLGVLGQQQDARAQQTADRNLLARSGLGRSGAMAQAGAPAQAGLASAVAGDTAQARQAGYETRLQGALRAFGAERDIAGLALAATPTPRLRTPDKASDLALFPTAVGGVLGGYLGGAQGAQVGAQGGYALGRGLTKKSSSRGT